jgi:cell division protein FtsI/penicillin-binding protein 2
MASDPTGVPESELKALAADAELEQAHQFELPEDPDLAIPSRLLAPPIRALQSMAAGEDLITTARKRPDGRLVLSRDSAEQVLTIDGALQEKLQHLLRSYQTPFGAVVALDPSTGRVLAMAEHSEQSPPIRGLTTRAVFPAASIFKIVTASALLEAGVKPADQECSHGGKRSISEKLWVESWRDRACYSLSTALARSANAVFAKLTHKHLTAESLLESAHAFYFNRPFDFPIPTDRSLAAIPEDALGLATAGSGFGDVYLSPLHGAAIASAIAAQGLWRAPILFEDDVQRSAEPERIISESNARLLASMLEETVRVGTARRTFHERGFRVVDAVGKTGSLADRRPFRDYSWFIGYAPKADPQIAVSAVVVNGPKWRIRATWLAREAMRLYLQGKSSSAQLHQP